MKCPNINSSEFKDMSEILGVGRARDVWSKNNGNPVKLTPSGKSSDLFNDIKLMQGTKSAIELKSSIYSLDFIRQKGDWFNGNTSSILDSKGEPLLSDVLHYQENGPFFTSSIFNKENDIKLERALTSWMNKLGIQTEAIKDIKKRYGDNIVAVADMSKMLIKYSKNEITIEDLYEEVAHFAIEGLGKDHPTVSKILELIEDTQMYKNNVAEYKVLYSGDMNKVRMEIAGKLLAETLIDKSQEAIDIETQSSPTLSTRLNSLMNGAMNQISNKFKGENEFTIDEMIKDSYGDIVNDIIAGKVAQRSFENINASQEYYASSKSPEFKYANEALERYKESLAARVRIIRSTAVTTSDRQQASKLNAKIKEIDNSIKTQSTIKSLEMFIDDASNITNQKFDEIKDIEITDQMSDIELKHAQSILNKVGQSIGVYTEAIMLINPELIRSDNPEFEKLKKKSDSLIRKEKDIESIYNDLAIDAGYLSFKDTLVKNKSISEKEFKDLLRKSNGDISKSGAMLLNMAQMSDEWLRVIDDKFKDVYFLANQIIRRDEIIITNAATEFGDTDTSFMYDGFRQVSDYDLKKYEEDKIEFVEKLVSSQYNKQPPGVNISKDISSMQTLIAVYENAIRRKEDSGDINAAELLNREYKKNFLEPMYNWVKDNLSSENVSVATTNNEMKALIMNSRDNVVAHNIITINPSEVASNTNNPTGYRLSSKYKSGKVEALNEAQREYYNKVMPILIKYDNQLGRTGLNGRMPQINKDGFEVASDDGLYAGVKEVFKSSIITRADDVDADSIGESELLNEKGESLKLVSSIYVNELKDLNELSRDATSTIIAFISEAGQTVAKREVVDSFQILANLIQNRVVTKKTVSGKVIASGDIGGGNSYDALMSNLDTRFFNKPRKIQKFKIGDLEIRGDKLLDLLGKYTAYNALALNIYAGIANPILGVNMLIQEGLAGEFWNSMDLIKATALYSGGLPGLMLDVGKLSSDNKLRLMMEKTDALQDIDDRLKNKKANRSGATRLFNMSALFMINHAGEHMLHGIAAIAFGENYARMLGLKDSSGNEIGFYDAFDVVDNDAVTKQGVTKKDGSQLNDVDVANFTKKLAHINQSLHGIYNKIDQNQLQKSAMGSLIMMFRKFMIPGFMRRYAKSKFDYIHEIEREGSMVTSVRWAAGSLIPQMLKEKLGIEKKIILTWDNATLHERANLIRTAATAMESLALLLLFTLLSGADDDDYVQNMAAFQARRVYSELQFYNPMNISEVLRIAKSPAAAVTELDNWAKTLKQLTPFEITERYKSGKNKGKLKSTHLLSQRIPLVRTIASWSTPEDKLNIFDR